MHRHTNVSCFFIFLQYWAFSDIQTGRVLTKVTDESAGCGKYVCFVLIVCVIVILFQVVMFLSASHSSHLCSVPPRWPNFWHWDSWFSNQDLGFEGTYQRGQLPRSLWTCHLHCFLWEWILSGHRLDVLTILKHSPAAVFQCAVGLHEVSMCRIINLH